MAHRHLSAAGHARDWFELVADRRCWREEISCEHWNFPLPVTDFVKYVLILFAVRQTLRGINALLSVLYQCQCREGPDNVGYARFGLLVWVA